MRVARLHFSSLLRALFAAALMLALLAGALPFAALSKTAHSCSMPCCAGGACATGACEGALFRKPAKIEEEKLCGAAKKPKAVVAEEGEHCHSNKKENERAQATTGAAERTRARVIIARALNAPCAKDCCAGASTSTQSRRGRDSTALTLTGEAVQPPLISLSYYSTSLRPQSSAHLKRLRARAPPF